MDGRQSKAAHPDVMVTTLFIESAVKKGYFTTL